MIAAIVAALWTLTATLLLLEHRAQSGTDVCRHTAAAPAVTDRPGGAA